MRDERQEKFLDLFPHIEESQCKVPKNQEVSGCSTRPMNRMSPDSSSSIRKMKG